MQAARATLAEICTVACAEAWRGDGEILASPIGPLPSLGARLARATFAPDLLLTDGVARLVTATGTIEGWMPYRRVFDVVWSGRRHVMMGASQIDRFGNQNIAQIGDAQKPERQLVGVRGAPGNTICHPTSYWIPNHSPRTFVPRVDTVWVASATTSRRRARPPRRALPRDPPGGDEPRRARLEDSPTTPCASARSTRACRRATW